MARPVHPDKDIEAAVSFAESKQWRYVAPGNSAHAWGRLFCPGGRPGDCKLSVYFAREAPSFDQAVESAKRDVARAGGQVVRVMQAPE
jgi:hypothetical protein